MLKQIPARGGYGYANRAFQITMTAIAAISQNQTEHLDAYAMC